MHLFNNIYKNRKIFITGHTGFKGSWLTLWLNSMGAEVAGYALPPATNPSIFDSLNLKSLINTKNLICKTTQLLSPAK